MADLLSELKELAQRKHSAPYVYYESIERIVKKYGWHDVGEPPTEPGLYQVTEKDEKGLYWQTAYWDPRHYPGDHWQSHCVVAWAPILDPYKPEAAK